MLLVISDARNKNEYNESHVVTAKKAPRVRKLKQK